MSALDRFHCTSTGSYLGKVPKMVLFIQFHGIFFHSRHTTKNLTEIKSITNSADAHHRFRRSKCFPSLIWGYGEIPCLGLGDRQWTLGILEYIYFLSQQRPKVLIRFHHKSNCSVILITSNFAFALSRKNLAIIYFSSRWLSWMIHCLRKKRDSAWCLVPTAVNRLEEGS